MSQRLFHPDGLRPRSAFTHQPPQRYGQTLRLLAATAVLGIAFDTVYSTLGNYLRDYYHLSIEAISWQFALNALLVIALQIPLSHSV